MTLGWQNSPDWVQHVGKVVYVTHQEFSWAQAVGAIGLLLNVDTFDRFAPYLVADPRSPGWASAIRLATPEELAAYQLADGGGQL